MMVEKVVNAVDERKRLSRFSDLLDVLYSMGIDFSAFWSGSACCIEIRASEKTVCLTFTSSEELKSVTCYTEVCVDSIALALFMDTLVIHGYRNGYRALRLMTKMKE